MQTKAKMTDFFSKDCPYFSNSDFGRGEMTSRQQQTLTELIYSRISDPESVEERLRQLEDFTYEDAKREIKDLTESKWG